MERCERCRAPKYPDRACDICGHSATRRPPKQRQIVRAQSEEAVETFDTRDTILVEQNQHQTASLPGAPTEEAQFGASHPESSFETEQRHINDTVVPEPETPIWRLGYVLETLILLSLVFLATSFFADLGMLAFGSVFLCIGVVATLFYQLRGTTPGMAAIMMLSNQRVKGVSKPAWQIFVGYTLLGVMPIYLLWVGARPIIRT